MTDPARLLITTALEDTWSFDTPVLFLGEWCRSHARQAQWQRLNSKTAPYHWNDRAKLTNDYAYLGDLYDRTLPCLADRLNQIHGVEHNLRYWKILVGPWLAYLMQILFDRWESIHLVAKDYLISETIILEAPKDSLVPRSMEHFFSELMAEHSWNHGIYGHILENHTSIRCIKKAMPPELSGIPDSRRTGPKISLKRLAFSYYSNLAARFARTDDIFLIRTYLSSFNEMKLHLRFKQLPQLWDSPPPGEAKIDWDSRKWSCGLSVRTDFEKCLASLIPIQIPATFVEGYADLVAQVNRLPWPKTPPALFTSNALWHDTVAMAYAAMQMENGAKLIYGQHGGFGLPQFIWQERHEREIADRYLTWGWTEQDSTNLVPVGILKDTNMYEAPPGEPTFRLLMVRGLWPPYTYRIDSGVGLPHLLKTIDDCLTLAELLPAEIRAESLTVRLYPVARAFSAAGRSSRSSDDFYGEGIRWHDRFPEVNLSNGLEPIANLVVQSRLVIYTYNGGTGYLEFMAANVPVIAFWDMKASPVRESAVPYFDELERIGIFHQTPESAAAHISQIWDDVDGWWRSREVQDVLGRFKSRYCHQPDDLLDGVESAIREAIQ